MRWARSSVEISLVLALAFTGFLLWVEKTKVRSPFLPPYVFTHDEAAGFLSMQGTLTLEGEDMAWPSQTTTIECGRTTNRCIEASAVLAGNEQLMPVVIHELTVLRWDSELVVVRGPNALCSDQVYTIHLLTQTVTALTTPKSSNVGAACALSSNTPKRVRMIDGYEASKVPHGWKPRSSN
jgi:hypothetical protein